MDWSRLSGTAVDALVVSFALGAVLSPPDPFTQILYVAPTFVVVFSALWLRGEPSVRSWWRRYALLVASVFAVGLAWRGATLALGLDSLPGGRDAAMLAGVALGAWLGYFGGLARLRGEKSDGERGTRSEEVGEA
ncbi:DUF7534 family protein [Halorussus salinus]|uniref:DUF7534 family protein n=1 Tax=Halorussus salinus TaxID=1364935 RepID=UPI00109251E2|nr:hypothetical protein [Halorussus salinus]